MRFAAAFLVVAVLGSPVWATDSATTTDSSNTGLAMQLQAPVQQSPDTVLLLLPSSEMDTFRHAVASTGNRDVQILPTSDAVSFQGKAYHVIALPASALQQLEQDLAGTPVHDALKVVLSFGQFVNTTDLSTAARATDPTTAQPAASAALSPSSGDPQASTAASLAGQPASFQPFLRNQVIVLMPADQLARLRQIPAPAGTDAFVIIPLEQLPRVMQTQAAQARLSAPMPQAPAMAESTATTTVLPSREPTSYSAPAASDRERLQILRPAGASNSVLTVIPVAGGTLITLRDGTRLSVPDSVNIQSSIRTGSNVRAEYEERDGQNLVTALEVSPQESGSDSGK